MGKDNKEQQTNSIMPHHEKGSITIEDSEWKESVYLKKLRRIISSFTEVSETTEEQFNELEIIKNERTK